MADWFDTKAIEVLSTLRGYSVEEIEAAIDESADDYDPDVAADVAYLTSALRDAATEGGRHA